MCMQGWIITSMYMGGSILAWSLVVLTFDEPVPAVFWFEHPLRGAAGLERHTLHPRVPLAERGGELAADERGRREESGAVLCGGGGGGVCVCVCARACVHAYLCACVRAYLCARVRARRRCYMT